MLQNNFEKIKKQTKEGGKGPKQKCSFGLEYHSQSV